MADNDIIDVDETYIVSLHETRGGNLMGEDIEFSDQYLDY